MKSKKNLKYMVILNEKSFDFTLFHILIKAIFLTLFASVSIIFPYFNLHRTILMDCVYFAYSSYYIFFSSTYAI